jgi:hypothetical protein
MSIAIECKMYGSMHGYGSHMHKYEQGEVENTMLHNTAQTVFSKAEPGIPRVLKCLFPSHAYREPMSRCQ